jgi:hypothetical protein
MGYVAQTQVRLGRAAARSLAARWIFIRCERILRSMRTGVRTTGQRICDRN